MISRSECDHPASQQEGRHCTACGADMIDVANEARLRVSMECIEGQARMLDELRTVLRRLVRASQVVASRQPASRSRTQKESEEWTAFYSALNEAAQSLRPKE